MLWAEFVVVMLFAVAPSFFAETSGSPVRLAPAAHIYFIFRFLAHLALVLYIVWIADGDFKAIGISKLDWRVDGKACLIILVGLVITSLFLIPFGGLRTPHYTSGAIPTSPPDGFSIALAVLSSCVSALFYEVMERGYAIGRLSELLGKPWLAVVILAVVFGAAQLRQSTFAGVFSILSGIILGASVIYSKRIWATILFAGISVAVFSLQVNR